MKKISAIIPSFREGQNLPTLINRLRENLQKEDFEILIVNDDDLTSSIKTIKKIEKEYPEVRGVFFRKRLGKTRAIKEGFMRSKGEIVVLIDADLQYLPEDIPRLIDELKNADVVNGIRVKRNDGLARKVESKVYNLLVHFFFGLAFHDCNSGLKVVKRKAMNAIIDELRDGWHRYILVLAAKKGYKISEVPVTHRARTRGQSKFSSSILKLFNGFRDLLAVKIFYRNS